MPSPPPPLPQMGEGCGSVFCKASWQHSQLLLVDFKANLLKYGLGFRQYLMIPETQHTIATPL